MYTFCPQRQSYVRARILLTEETEIQVKTRHSEICLNSKSFCVMKKNIIRFACMAFATVAAISCQKDINEPESSKVQGKQEFVFNLEKADLKTSLQIVGNKPDMTWENTANSSIHIYANDKEGTDASLSISRDNQTAQIRANFSLSELYSSVTFKSVIAANFANGVATVPAVQNPAATSFDPAADVLIGESNAIIVVDAIFDRNVDMKFARLNAVSRLAFTGLKPGEKVELVEIIAENNIAGALKPFNEFRFAGYAAEGSKKITLNFSSNNTVANDGTFATFFTSWAVKPGALKINVFTDQGEYTKTTPKEAPAFQFDVLGNFKVDMSGCAVPPSYELVTSAPASWEGTYLFASSNTPGSVKVFDAGNKSSYAATATVKNEGGKIIIASDATTNALAWEVSKSGNFWDVMKDGKYLFDNGGIKVESDCYTGLALLTGRYHRHSFSLDNGVQMASNSISLVGTVDGKTYFGYNGSKFAYSNNSGNRVYLFKLKDNGRQSQNLIFKDASVKFILKEGGHVIGGTYDAQSFAAGSSYGEGLITYSSSDPSIAAIDPATGKITIKKEGEVIITAKAASTTSFRGASASYVLTISSPYYQKVTSANEIVSGDKYIIVSETDAWFGYTKRYHAFSATSAGYDVDLNSLLGNGVDKIVYDNGNKIKAIAKVNENQVIIEKDNTLINALGKLVGLKDGYTIKNVSDGKYLYCDMTADIAGVPILAYQIAFTDKSLDFSSGWSLTKLTDWFNERATIPHSFEFGDNGVVSIKNATSKNFSIGADLRYIGNQYSYVNMNVLKNFESVADLMNYLAKDSQYAALAQFISTLGKNIDLGQLIDYLSADLYIFRYVE